MNTTLPLTPSRLLLLPLCCVLLLGACGSAPDRELSTYRSPFVTLPNGHDPLDTDQFVSGISGQSTVARNGIIPHYEALRGHPLNILEISGGGQNGAFGAGVLKGWRESGSRPQFDVVTGVSTGALLATHAFLGTAADDAVLEQLFTNIDRADVYTRRSLIDTLFGNSIVDTTPLKQLIASVITEQTLQRVAAAYDNKRLLWAGTTNIDYSQTWAWNLTAIAKHGGPGALALYRDVLLASASPPAIFPPVEIHGHLLADGMLRANLLVIGLGGDERPGPPAYGPGTIYIIQNGKGIPSPAAIPNDILDVSSTSLGQMMDGFSSSLILRAFIAARAHGYRFRLLDIPTETPIGSNPLAFNQQQMRAGFQVGYQLGLKPDAWLRQPRVNGDVPTWAYEKMDH